MPVLKVGARRVHLFGSSRGGWYPDAEVARFLAQSRRLESRRTVDSFFNRPTGINDGELTGIESPDTDRGPAVPLDEVVRQGWPGVKITHRGNPRKREREKERKRVGTMEPPVKRGTDARWTKIAMVRREKKRVRRNDERKGRETLTERDRERRNLWY